MIKIGLKLKKRTNVLDTITSLVQECVISSNKFLTEERGYVDKCIDRLLDLGVEIKLEAKFVILRTM